MGLNKARFQNGLENHRQMVLFVLSCFKVKMAKKNQNVADCPENEPFFPLPSGAKAEWSLVLCQGCKIVAMGMLMSPG